MQVSVPGMYQNPAPYREQILTYSTALAFTGRSAACAPPMAARAAAEPRTRLLTIFIAKTSKLLSLFRRLRTRQGISPSGLAPKNRSVVSRLATHPLDAGPERTTKRDDPGSPAVI